MGRSITALGFVVILALGVIGALAGLGSGDRFGDPPEQLIQYDEQTTASFNESAATRENVNQLLVVLAVTIGFTGIVVVGMGHFEDDE